jgi:hypothetical protein
MMAYVNDQTKRKVKVSILDRDSALPPYAPSYDEKEFEDAIEKGTRAWADVPDAVAWVRELRGNDDG